MEFYKMHGCGNDFCIMEYEEQINYELRAKEICDRKHGVGADGLILVRQDPLEMVYYNPDGTKASMNGNGIRCFARYCYEKKIVKEKKFDCLTQAGIMHLEIAKEDPFLVRVDMGKPIFNNQMIHVSDHIESFGRLLTVENYHLTIYSFFIGTIHTVIFVDSLDSKVLNLAEKICKNPLFKSHTNVNFVKIIDRKTLQIRTYGRGVGWTLACGTGACAAMITAYKLGLVDSKIKVKVEAGELGIEITKKEAVFMEGPAVLSYIGAIKEC